MCGSWVRCMDFFKKEGLHMRTPGLWIDTISMFSRCIEKMARTGVEWLHWLERKKGTVRPGRPTCLYIFGVGLFMFLTGWYGCSKNSNTPPSIQYGMEMCDSCHMVMSDERFGSVVRSSHGEEYRFDDVMCLARFLHEKKISGEIWVKTFDTLTWVRLSSVQFVQTSIQTPMGSGIIAVSQSYHIKPGESQLSWESILQNVQAFTSQGQRRNL